MLVKVQGRHLASLNERLEAGKHATKAVRDVTSGRSPAQNGKRMWAYHLGGLEGAREELLNSSDGHRGSRRCAHRGRRARKTGLRLTEIIAAAEILLLQGTGGRSSTCARAEAGTSASRQRRRSGHRQHTKALVLVSPTARMPQEPSSEPETRVISRVTCNDQTKDHYKIHYVVYFHIWTTSVLATCDSKVDATTSSTDTYRPLRPGGGRILTGVRQLLCEVFEKTAVQHVTPPFTMLHHLNQSPEHVRYATVSGAVHVWHAIRCRDNRCEA